MAVENRYELKVYIVRIITGDKCKMSSCVQLIRWNIVYLCFILGGDDDLDEGGTRMSRPDGTTEENSPESEEGQPGGVSYFDSL